MVKAIKGGKLVKKTDLKQIFGAKLYKKMVYNNDDRLSEGY